MIFKAVCRLVGGEAREGDNPKVKTKTEYVTGFSYAAAEDKIKSSYFFRELAEIGETPRLVKLEIVPNSFRKKLKTPVSKRNVIGKEK